MFQNAMLPAGFRQRDQTKKSPTGPFDRSALLDHLEKQALEHEDREDLVPFTGEKKGSLAATSIKKKKWNLSFRLNLSLFLGKKFIPKPGAGKIPEEEQITLEPELEEALKNATDAEMCDIAGWWNGIRSSNSQQNSQPLFSVDRWSKAVPIFNLDHPWPLLNLHPKSSV